MQSFYSLILRNLRVVSFTVLSLWVTQTSAALEEEVVQAKQCVLKIGTGPAKKGFSNLFRDIKKMCGDTVNICETQTSGGAENATSLASNKQDLGMVTVDILQNLKNSDENIGSLQAVMPLNANLLHVLTKTGGYTIEDRKPGEKKFGFIKGDDVVTRTQVVIRKFSELKGQKVALVGSAKIMARTIEQTLGYQMKFIDAKDDAAAKAMVLNGQVYAMMTVSGYPNGFVDEQTSTSGLSIVNYDLQPSPPYIAIRKNYAKMNVLGATFLAVPSVLVTRPFKPSGVNGRNVAALQACIVSNLDNLKEGGPDWGDQQPQPGWKEIKDFSTYGWPAFSPNKK